MDSKNEEVFETEGLVPRTRNRSCKTLCCKCLKSECHYTALCFCYKDNKPFAFTPWLPYKIKWQFIYLIWRWVLMLYFFGWLIYSFALAGSQGSLGAKYLIFLTNWGFLLFNFYLIVSAVSSTLNMIVYYRNPKPLIPTFSDSRDEQRMKCSCLSLLSGIHWLSAMLGIEFAMGITILFWSFFMDFSLLSIHIHLLNGIVAFIDMSITGVPIRLLHFLYAIAFGSLYVVFSLLYFAAGQPAIYPVLDYENQPDQAAVVAICCGLVFPIGLHLAVYFIYMVRYAVSWLLQRHLYQRNMSLTDTSEHEENA